jgi:hypothetical protein
LKQDQTPHLANLPMPEKISTKISPKVLPLTKIKLYLDLLLQDLLALKQH